MFGTNATSNPGADCGAPYHVQTADAGHYHATNAAQGWQIAYDVDDTTRLVPRSSTLPAWTWGAALDQLRLQPISVDHPTALQAHADQYKPPQVRVRHATWHTRPPAKGT